MAIPLNLLRMTESRALGTVVYGGAGLWKTLAKHTLPGPVLDLDFEGGNVALMPWIRRRRRWDETKWREVSQEDRLAAFAQIDSTKRATTIAPQPLIDTIWYDNTVRESYTTVVADIASLDIAKYNSISVDSLMELSQDIQAFSKPAGGVNEPLPNALLWAPIQERTGMLLRKLRNLRDSGIFIYMTGQEIIDKDYVIDPRFKKQGEAAPEAYAVKGTVDVPGKMVNAVQHVTDLMFHARLMSGAPVWATGPEPLPGGSANWEAKDRTGRIKDKFVRPNFRTIFKDIYGEEGLGAIYGYAKELLDKG